MLKGLFLILMSMSATVFAGSPEMLQPKPLTEVVSQTKGKVKAGTVQVPMITWGGDMATIYAEQSGVFSKNGQKVKIFVENNFPKQVEACLAGRTPYLRGTIGMINAAAEVFEKQGVDLVVIYQLTWSTGGDALVVRKNVKKPRQLKNKTVALQLYGPHMDYLANILASSNVSPADVELKWFRELTLPTYDTGGKTVDPVNGFLENENFDGVMAIIPDALSLTSGGTVGSGAAGSVKGAKIMLSTKTASRVIADVYAVRSDYLAANRGKVEAFTKSLLQAQEGLQDLVANKASRRSEYQQLMSRGADLLLGAPQAVPDVEALMGDCEFAGYDGNVAFFTGAGTTRTLGNLNREIQKAFGKMNLVNKRVDLKGAAWDYGKMAKGLKYASKVPKPKKRFDTKKVAAKIEEKISVEPTSWAEEGTLFQVEINFAPNQSEFSDAEYADDFEKAMSISQTYGGSLVIIEGHSDPLGILKAKQKKQDPVIIRQMEQQAKNLSLERSRAVRDSFLKFVKTKGLNIDDSQFVAVGIGTVTPKFSPPRTKEEWAANRRVVFRIKQVEAELSDFVPLD